MRLPSPTSWGLPNPASAASPAARLLYDRGLLAHHCGMAPFGTRYGAYDSHPSQGGGPRPTDRHVDNHAAALEPSVRLCQAQRLVAAVTT